MLTAFQTSEDLKTFANDLLKRANLDNVPSETREAYIDRIAVQAQQFVGMAIIQAISDDGAKALAEAIDEKGDADQEKVKAVFAKHLPSAEDVISESLSKYAATFLQAEQK